MHITFALVLGIALSGPRPGHIGVVKCDSPRPDSLVRATPPIYRACDVDKPARLHDAAPALNFYPERETGPRGQCYSASLEFVVGQDGAPEMDAVTPRNGSSPELQAVLRAQLSKLRYDPGLIAGFAVRQLVVYSRTLWMRVTRASPVNPQHPFAYTTRSSC